MSGDFDHGAYLELLYGTDVNSPIHVKQVKLSGDSAKFSLPVKSYDGEPLVAIYSARYVYGPTFSDVQIGRYNMPWISPLNSGGNIRLLAANTTTHFYFRDGVMSVGDPPKAKVNVTKKLMKSDVQEYVDAPHVETLENVDGCNQSKIIGTSVSISFAIIACAGVLAGSIMSLSSSSDPLGASLTN